VSEVENVDIADVESTPQVLQDEVVRLPFSYAKRFGVLVNYQQQQPRLFIKVDTPINALLECQRALSKSPEVVELSDADFEHELE
jgi:general secretion pathway protein E